MKTQVNCHTCRFSDWGYKYQSHEINPCSKCIGFHKWAKRHANKKDDNHIAIKCDHCSNEGTAVKKCPYTGYAYNSGWVTRCSVCGSNMKEVIDG